MTAGDRLDRAVAALGVASVASAIFLFVRGDFEFVQVRGWGVAVALVLGLLAVAGGRWHRRALSSVAGAGFLVAAAGQVAGWAAGANVLGGDGSTASLWLGLGVGILIAAHAPRWWSQA